MSSSPPEAEAYVWDGNGLTHPRAKHELWTITFAFFDHDKTHAHTSARHAARRLAKVLPWFNKDAVTLARETDPYHGMPVYCDDDTHCALEPHHDGPCRTQDGADLDRLDLTRDDTPTFGADL